MAVKYNTYVGVFFSDPDTREHFVKFVTGVEKSAALWEDGKPAMRVTEPFAKDIVCGLTFNGFHAAIIKALNCIELRN